MLRALCLKPGQSDAAHHYCTPWKLAINTRKIKVMIFSRGKILEIFQNLIITVCH